MLHLIFYSKFNVYFCYFNLFAVAVYMMVHAVCLFQEY